MDKEIIEFIEKFTNKSDIKETDLLIDIVYDSFDLINLMLELDFKFGLFKNEDKIDPYKSIGVETLTVAKVIEKCT